MIKYSSLSYQLLRSILVIYFIITLIITLIHFIIEFNYTKTNINQELKTITETFKPPLSEAMWELDTDQVVNISKGIYNIPLIYGIEIHDHSYKTISKILDTNLSQEDMEDQKLIYTFEISYRFNNKDNHLGEVTLYSSNKAVFDRVKVGFSMIFLNAMIKSTLLLILFIIAFNRYLKTPLESLTKTISNMQWSDPKNRNINIKFHDQNELTILQDNFNELLEKISKTEFDRIETIKKLNSELEEKVKQRTHELQEEKDKFEAIYKTSKDGIALLDINSTKFLDANPAYSEITGYTKAELLNTSCLELSIEEDKERSREAIEEVKKQGFVKDFTKTCISKNGDHIITSMSIALMNDKKRILVSVKDITKQKELEYNIIKQKEEAEFATKLKSVFLANMSHEIRTPMHGILGMSHLALESRDTLKQKEYITKIDKSAKNLLSILNDILDFSKIEAGKLSIEKINFDLNSVISYIKNIVELKAYEKDLKFYIFYNSEQNNIYYGDPVRIGQILVNLVNNAIKFTHKGSIEVHIEDLPNNIVRFTVKDTGIGITKENQEKLFESFSQADGSTTRKYGGTGLGLSISKQLVELMDGTIKINSTPNKGSEFSFDISLPKGSKENIFDDKSSLKTLQSSISSIKESNILLVEDNSTNQEIIHSLLETSNIKIDDAYDGVMALQIYQSNPYKYDLIIMDIQMPLMDGYEATREIRKLNKKIPIIALSANALSSEKEASIDAGMNEHLNKPVNIEQLYTMLLKYLPIEYDLSSQEKRDDSAFKNIDKNKGLQHMGGNEELYNKILSNFYNNYKELNLNEIDENELKITIHTLKGLSGNIGAQILYQRALEWETNFNDNSIEKLQNQLNIVCEEIKNSQEDQNSVFGKKTIDIEETKELFSKLKEAVESKRPKRINEVIEELQNYDLNEKGKILFNHINSLVKRYKFNEANKILEENNL
ncbi:MAG: ATP-binding protein [Campylobacterota bacterium]|nr:ATP-binding protein [Campylobacterota bacterium]